MTKIQWTNETWNPVTGCTKVSQGCKHCYAERDFPRVYAKTGRKFVDIALHPERLEKPKRWTKPRMIFVNSMSDLFHEDVPDSFIDQVFAVMAMRPQHTFQVLTKRPQRMRDYVSAIESKGGMFELVRTLAKYHGDRKLGPGTHIAWPQHNVWLGVSVEDQDTANERIPLLLETPAALRWVSYEPAIDGVWFGNALVPSCILHGALESDGKCDVCHARGIWGPGSKPREPVAPTLPGLDWVVIGGESGPRARPFDIQWARSTVQQCKAAGVPVFVKQLGARVNWNGCSGPDEHWPAGTKTVDHGNGGWHVMLSDPKGGDPAEWPDDLRVREWPEVRS